MFLFVRNKDFIKQFKSDVRGSMVDSVEAVKWCKWLSVNWCIVIIQLGSSPSSSVALQEQFWRSVLFHNHYSFLSSNGYEIDEEGQNQSQKEQQELLMKMFAVSMKTLRQYYQRTIAVESCLIL